ncbi:MAG: hypothetical protein H7Z37_12185 [Pyrinomonadaceae bacterium]|nr:hypothetical protein [Pyrinomonadaceae bacterium]
MTAFVAIQGYFGVFKDESLVFMFISSPIVGLLNGYSSWSVNEMEHRKTAVEMFGEINLNENFAETKSKLSSSGK